MHKGLRKRASMPLNFAQKHLGDQNFPLRSLFQKASKYSKPSARTKIGYVTYSLFTWTPVHLCCGRGKGNGNSSPPGGTPGKSCSLNFFPGLCVHWRGDSLAPPLQLYLGPAYWQPLWRSRGVHSCAERDGQYHNIHSQVLSAPFLFCCASEGF